MGRMRGFLWVAVVAGLAGCSVLGGGTPPTPTPVVEAAEQSLPGATIPGVPAPTEEQAGEEDVVDEPAGEPTTEEPAAGTGAQPAGTAEPGDILFVRDGQIWRIGVDGTGESQLTDFVEGAVIRNLVVSPDGRYAAFALNGTDVAVLDLEAGELTIRDSVPPDIVDGVTWAPEGDTLFYYRITDDPEGFEAAEDSGRWQMLYQLDVEPAGEPEPLTGVAEASGADLAIQAALGEGRLLLTEHQLEEGFENRLLLFDGGLAPLDAEDFTSVAVVDVSPDGSRVLFIDQSEVDAEGAAAPLPLYQADLNLTPTEGGLANALSLVPDPDARYSDARYAPDGATLAAVHSLMDEEGGGSAIVLMVPNGVGGYARTSLDTAEGYDYLALAWHGSGVVTQGFPADGEVAEIWLLPLDGEAGLRLAEGEQPQVVGGR